MAMLMNFSFRAEMLTSRSRRPGTSYIQAAASSVAVAPQGQIRPFFNQLKTGAVARGRFVCPSSRDPLRPAVGACALPPPSGHIARLASVFRVASRVNTSICMPTRPPLLKAWRWGFRTITPLSSPPRVWLGPSPTMLDLCTRFCIRYTGQRRDRRIRRFETPIVEVFYAGLSFQRRVQETIKKETSL